MKVTVLMLAILGIASAGKLGHGHHTDDHSHSHSHSHPSPGQGVNSGEFGPNSGGRGPNSGGFVPSSGGQGPFNPGFPSGTGAGQGIAPLSDKVEGNVLLLFSFSGIMSFINHFCIFRNGELRMLGPLIDLGENGDFLVQEGTGSHGTGETAIIGEGLLNVRRLEATDTQALQTSLNRAGITLNQLTQQIGVIPQQGIFEVTAGVLSIDGVLRNVRAGIFIALSVDVVDFNNEGDGDGVRPGVSPGIAETRTITVTETAAHETNTVTEPVILTKTQTQDEYVTITSPVYNSIAATIVNIVKQTVTVPEEQVIRSPVAGSVVVNTIPVATQTVLTVSVRSTNMFVRTVNDEVTNEHTHYVTNYSISTATVNNPVTSTVTQPITQTRVSTVYNTSTVGKTVYATTTLTVNIGTASPGTGDYY